MLRSFRLENYRSFRDEAELSLLSAYDKERSVVPVAAIYGANAAGKSNVLTGLQFMATAVVGSYRWWEPGGGVPRQPFRLDLSGRTRPSTFAVDVVLGGVRYMYGFVVDDDIVLEEWLYSYPKRKRRVLFEREGAVFSFGESLRHVRAASDVLQELTRPNALFLSLAAQVGVKELGAVYEWFLRLARNWADAGRVSRWDWMRRLAERLRGDPGFRSRVMPLVCAADVGITEMVVDEVSIESSPDVFSKLSGGADEVGYEYLQSVLRGQETLSRVRFRHGMSTLFEVGEESEGTRAWLTLLPRVLDALDEGGILVIDEIDSSLHPLLTTLLVKQFRTPEINPKSAQLLFTTHDATLLGTSFGEEVLARDEIWFVEKDPDGASRLYPLTDFHPRIGENRERRYLGGSYGGVPLVGETVPDAAGKGGAA